MGQAKTAKYVGIDVSKDTLDVMVRPNGTRHSMPMMRMASLNSSSIFDGNVRPSWYAKRPVGGSVNWSAPWQR